MTRHADREHRKYSPSQAERFTVCYGSTNLLARVPARPAGPYAEEGTAAHEVLQAALVNGVWDAEVAHREYSTRCMETLNDDTNFFYFSIQIALDYIRSLLDALPGAELHVEQYVRVPSDACPGEADGHCDVYIYHPLFRVLYVIDYKHGAGVAKDAVGNKQLLQYGAGVIYADTDGRLNPAIDPVDDVMLVIVQPRAFHRSGAVREWAVTPYEVYEYLGVMDAAICENEKPDAPLVPDDGGRTTDHCRFCDAATVCPAREAKAVAVVGKQFRTVPDVARAVLPAPEQLDINRLVYISQNAGALRKFLDAVDDHLNALARQGYNIPGKKLVEVEARREWYGEPMDVAKKLAALVGVPVERVMTQKVLPITHAEKLVVEAFRKRAGRGNKDQAAENARQAMAFLTLKKSSGNLVLVDEDDERPAVNRAQNAFASVPPMLVLPPPPKQ